MNKTKRFIIGKDTIKDTKTGIIWQRDLGKYGDMTYNDAIKLSKKENKLIPTREDWQSLNNGNYPKKQILKDIGFINVRLWYCTSDEYNNYNAWFVSFGNGYDFYSDKNGTACVTLIKK